MSFRTCLRTGWALALLLIGSARPLPAAIDVPIAIEIAPARHALPDQIVTLQGRVVAGAALGDVSIQLSTEGPVRLAGPVQVMLGAVERGGSLPFSVPVIYTTPAGAGEAAVRFRVVARHAESGVEYEKNDGVYGVWRGGVFHQAVGDYLIARMDALEAELADGTITSVLAETERASLRVLPGQWSQTPVAGFPVPAELQPVAALYNGAISAGLDPDAVPGEWTTQGLASGNVTYNGNVAWEDRFGTNHAAAGLRVVVIQELLGIEVVSASTICDASGNYSMNALVVPGADTWVQVQTENSVISLQAMNSGGFYIGDSPHHFDPPNGSTVTENLVVQNTGNGPSVGLLVTTTYLAGYLASLNGGTALAQLRMEWPGSSTTAFYSPSQIFINLRPLDRWAYDVAHHEYGHYIMDVFNFEDNPGGPHNIGDCIADVHDDDKSEGIRLAWGEGWPTFFGTAGQVFQNLAALNIPTLGDVTYTDTEAGNFSYSLEDNSGPPLSQDNRGRGEDNEIAVQRILWDLVDSNSEGHDNTTISNQTLFDIVKPSGATSLSAYWALVRAAAPNTLADLAYGGITTDHLVGPRLTGPANNAVVSPSANKTFSWNADVGCPTSYSGNQFTLRFFTPGGTQVLSIGGLATTSTTISDGQLATLIAAGHNLIWAVEGSHTASPATGPYLGENRAIVVNRPPVADAGDDQTVECASHTATAVQLDGTGSSDPDGDALTYTWSATGVTFDDANSPTPIGQFPEGTHTVTLTVSDGILEDTDQVQITIVDTTPPVVSCPANLTIECNSHCDPTLGGVPATDPVVAAWLASFTATDVCDDSPDTSLPTPACFPLGETEVTFTATDDAGNSASCTRKVIVVDTTPPVVAVSLDRTSLWPANHKMVPITATVEVTDVCDPNPTFQLWSITCNEPVNDLGDGNTEPDIQGADLFTPDLEFSLRSERMGTRPGRIYTITYRGFDGSGNTADAVAEVTVAHDQALVASPAEGWNADGTGFAPGAGSFALVIRSIPDDAVMGDLPGGEVQGLNPAVPLLLDAGALDPPQLLVGNTAGALQPLRTVVMDADGDGLRDVVAWYRVADALAIHDRSDLLDGPVGLHVKSPAENYLATSIFALGAPIALPPIPADGVTAGAEASGAATATRAAVESGEAVTDPPAGAGEAASPAPALDPPALAEALPGATRFEGVVPNPVAGRATLAFSLAHDAPVELAIYNVAGARVRSLHSGTLGAGRYAFTWDGRDAAGHRLPGGVYFVRFSAGAYGRTTKTVLMH